MTLIYPQMKLEDSFANWQNYFKTIVCRGWLREKTARSLRGRSLLLSHACSFFSAAGVLDRQMHVKKVCSCKYDVEKNNRNAVCSTFHFMPLLMRGQKQHRKMCSPTRFCAVFFIRPLLSKHFFTQDKYLNATHFTQNSQAFFSFWTWF